MRPFLTTCLTLLLCTVAVHGHAQRVYKSVGPDGKVTFSDQPPVGQEVAPRGSGTPAANAPAEAAAKGSSADVPAAQGGAKQASRKVAAQEPAPKRGPAKLDPAVEKSVFVLMGYESIVASFQDVCLKTLPTSFKKFDGAAQSWRQRHAAVLSRYPVVLGDHFTTQEQANLRLGVRNKTQGMMSPVNSASMAAKIKWCDQNTDELNSGKLDLSAAHSAALQGYRPAR